MVDNDINKQGNKWNGREIYKIISFVDLFELDISPDFLFIR